MNDSDTAPPSISDIHQNILLERLSIFIQLLREENFSCDTSSVLDAAKVCSSGYLEHRLLMRQGLRTCLCHSLEEWTRFDALFDHFWKSASVDTSDHQITTDNEHPHSSEDALRNRLIGFSASSDDQDLDNNMTGAGDSKTLSLADFRFVFDKHQMQSIEQLVDTLAKRIRHQRRRRTKAANSAGRVDLRRSQHKALSTNGTFRELAYRQPAKRLPAFVLLLDISQSMEVYSKLFLRFTRQLMSEFDRSQAYTFNTQLFPLGSGDTRLTEKDFESVMNENGKGWLGGTRIAQCFQTFNSTIGPRVLNSRTTLLIFSDGYDTDKPQALVPEMDTLQRRSRRVIWVNPLLGRSPENLTDPRMEPIMPFLDTYCSGHNLEALSSLGKLLAQSPSC